jgi:hypothetical protein
VLTATSVVECRTRDLRTVGRLGLPWAVSLLDSTSGREGTDRARSGVWAYEHSNEDSTVACGV